MMIIAYLMILSISLADHISSLLIFAISSIHCLIFAIIITGGLMLQSASIVECIIELLYLAWSISISSTISSIIVSCFYLSTTLTSLYYSHKLHISISSIMSMLIEYLIYTYNSIIIHFSSHLFSLYSYFISSSNMTSLLMLIIIS